MKNMIKYRSSINPNKVYEYPVELEQSVESQVVSSFYSPTKMEDVPMVAQPEKQLVP